MHTKLSGHPNASPGPRHLSHSLVQPAGEASDSFRHEEDVVPHQPTQRHRVNRTVQLRQAVQHNRLT